MPGQNLPSLGALPLDPLVLVLGLGGLIALLLITLVVVAIVGLVRRSHETASRTLLAHTLDSELAEMKGRLQTLAEISVSRQSDLARALNERLDRVSQRVGQDLTETSRKTAESLSKLHERLAVIDSAQKNLTELSGNVVTLQEILANKQARGAFGQGRMEAIIQDCLPKDAFAFQVTLSNGKRPDCVVRLPNAPGFVIDAKFPLEAFEALRSARTDTHKKDAMRLIRQDVGRHVEAIAGSYLIPGETQDSALMFVPSESLYADLHEHFPDLLQKAHRARVFIVSPNMLMLAVQTMQVILKDVQMREQAGVIQTEVTRLMADVHRLRDRVLDLQRHFGMTGTDIEKILTSADKIANRGRRIEALELDDVPRIVEGGKEQAPAASRPAQQSRPAPPPQPDLLAGE